MMPELGIDAAIELIDGKAHAALAAAPERWSPDNPRLYDVEIRLGEDVVRDRVGFRTIERRGTDILLNGEPVWLRGISVHEDDLEAGQGHERSRSATPLRACARTRLQLHAARPLSPS
jgi:beta-glucuronidase